MPDTDKVKADFVMIGNTIIFSTDPDINVINPPEIQSIPVVAPANPNAKN
jgi:hypothetical protein